MCISLAVTVVAVLVFGSAGAFLGHRLPVPAGVLLGTLVAVGLAGGGGMLLGLPRFSIPPGTMGLLQILLGMLVGLRMSRDELRSGAHVSVAASLLTAVLVPAAIASALVAASLTSVDVVTALFAAA